jgi:hypothetical protein
MQLNESIRVRFNLFSVVNLIGGLTLCARTEHDSIRRGGLGEECNHWWEGCARTENPLGGCER